MKQQGGFTLIELIVVIVILGILAATALPKFSGLAVDARVAKMQGVAAALKDAAIMAHGQSLAEQLLGGSSVTIEDGTVIGMNNYYPDATASGIELAIDGTGISSAVAGSGVEFYPDAGRINCKVVYEAALITSGAPAAPVIDASQASGVANCE